MHWQTWTELTEQHRLCCIPFAIYKRTHSIDCRLLEHDSFNFCHYRLDYIKHCCESPALNAKKQCVPPSWGLLCNECAGGVSRVPHRMSPNFVPGKAPPLFPVKRRAVMTPKSEFSHHPISLRAGPPTLKFDAQISLSSRLFLYTLQEPCKNYLCFGPRSLLAPTYHF